MPAPLLRDWWLWQCHGLLNYSDGICCVQLTLGHHPQGSNLITSVPKSRKAQISIMTLLLFIWVGGAIQGGTWLGGRRQSSQLTASKDPRTSVLYPQRAEFCQHAEWAKSWMKGRLAEAFMSTLWNPEQGAWLSSILTCTGDLMKGGLNSSKFVFIYLFIIFRSSRKMNAAHLQVHSLKIKAW